MQLTIEAELAKHGKTFAITLDNNIVVVSKDGDNWVSSEIDSYVLVESKFSPLVVDCIFKVIKNYEIALRTHLEIESVNIKINGRECDDSIKSHIRDFLDDYAD